MATAPEPPDVAPRPRRRGRRRLLDVPTLLLVAAILGLADVRA
jgi:hypothetical protein